MKLGRYATGSKFRLLAVHNSDSGFWVLLHRPIITSDSTLITVT